MNAPRYKGSIAGEAHIGRRLRVGIGADVDQRRDAALHRALDRGTDILGLLDKFTIATERLDHLVIALIAEVAADIAAGLARGKPAVVGNYDDDREFVADGGVHLHAIPAEGAVTAQDHYRAIRGGGLGADAERNAHAHASVRTGIEARAGLICRNRLAGEIENFVTVNDENGVAGNHVLDFIA